MDTNELILKTAFCCMACDGEIAKEEIDLIKRFSAESELIIGLNVNEKVNQYVSEINQQGRAFLNNFLKELSHTDLSQEFELQIIKFAIQTIEADNKIEYSEISFFKKIRKRLKISNEEILAELPDIEDYLLPDIEVDLEEDWTCSFSEIDFNIITLPSSIKSKSE